MPTPILPKYKCTQLELYSIADTAWDNCTAHLSDFTAYKSKYDAAFVAGKKAAITAAAALPDDQTRETAAELGRVNLSSINVRCTLNFQKLKGYIEDAYPKDMWKAQFEAAGADLYKRATEENWENTIGLNNNMNGFLSVNGASLVAAGMPAGFPANVTSDSDAFKSAYDHFKTNRQTGTATGSKIDANNAIYEDMQLMFKDAKRVFPTDFEMLKNFTFKTLKDMVSPPGSSSLTISLIRDIINSPIANATVTIQTEDGTPLTSTTDAEGLANFESINPDRYNVNVVAASLQPLTLEKDVDTGVAARLNLKMQAL